ncbi:hypothetical protein NDU88_002590 [Pleurodeles waltl]|uniref:Reverse transcriptase zinc-binding domain-containing protein n=1 Tax=Pleurodeles waltl TaxID=8319 RepID=A0AAV7NGZ1_PLEWA|nr:hypothetical protein NDU88_002590 [Pleurodeles waltl]
MVAPLPLGVAICAKARRPREDVDTARMLQWVWEELRKRAGVPLLYAPSLPLLHNPMLPCVADGIAGHLIDKMNLRTFADLFPNGKFMPPPEPGEGGEVPFSESFLYHRLRAACRTLCEGFPDPPPIFTALEAVVGSPSPRKLITRIYRHMQNMTPEVTPKSMLYWNEELQPEISGEQWEFCCGQLAELSPNYKLRLVHFKYLHRFYRTPINLKRMGLRETDECWRCGSALASFLHIAWSCPRLKDYWSQVFASVNQIVGRSDAPSPLLGLLGYVRDTPPEMRRLHALLLLFAKRRVAIHWGRPRVPAVRDWLADVTYGHTQLTTFWELTPAASRPRDIWDPFVCWAREQQSQE